MRWGGRGCYHERYWWGKINSGYTKENPPRNTAKLSEAIAPKLSGSLSQCNLLLVYIALFSSILCNIRGLEWLCFWFWVHINRTGRQTGFVGHTSGRPRRARIHTFSRHRWCPTKFLCTSSSHPYGSCCFATRRGSCSFVHEGCETAERCVANSGRVC